ncbi:uncharacterized protein Dg [Lepeophtheirus salmonis]|nr:dystroglycan-like [Lepeophtheirus salmonis]
MNTLHVNPTHVLEDQKYEDSDGSGSNVDDDDEDFDSPEIVPSRIVPAMTSPSFMDPMGSTLTPLSPKTSHEMTLSMPIDGSGHEADMKSVFYYPTPAVIQPSSVVPEIIVKSENMGPQVNKKLPKVPVTIGKLKKFTIPDETFLDTEDGNSRNLSLFLKAADQTTKAHNSWIKFDPKTLEIKALPVNPDYSGTYNFMIQAIDSMGASVMTDLEMVLRMHPSSRLFHHKFIMKYIPNDSEVDIFKIVDHMMKYLGGELKGVVVRNIRNNYIAWTYESLVTQSCPLERIQAIKHRIMSESLSLPSTKFRAFMKKLIQISSITFEFEGLCYEETVSTSVRVDDNSQPSIRNPINRLNVTAGELLRFKVPEDTCFDQEDRYLENLEMHILTMNRKQLSPKAWLQFDPKNKEFYGVPLEEEVGREEYQLVCSDSQGLSAIDGIEVVVSTRPFSERYFVEFDFEFVKEPYISNQMDYPRRKVRFMEDLAHYFGDRNASNIVIKSIADDLSHIVWYNKSFIYSNCKKDDINWMKNKMLKSVSNMNKKESRVQDDLIQIFNPSLKLKDINIILKGSCVDLIKNKESQPKEKDNRTIFHGIIPFSDYILTFIFPAIIITGMMLLALLLACLLHRKRKAGKLNIFYSESLPPRVPVILQDELHHANHDEYNSFIARNQLNNTPALKKKHHEENQHLLNKSNTSDISFSRPAPVYQRS